jgi:pilus assembly protein Flp/PilA
MRLLKSFVADTTGATAIEYGLIAALIFVGLLTGLGSFSNALTTVFNVSSNAMATAGTQ